MISLTAHGICNIIGGKLVSGPFDRVASGGVCTDSRHLPPHAVFFALGGEKFDGNLFAPEASRTAAAAVVSRSSCKMTGRPQAASSFFSALTNSALAASKISSYF